MDDADYEALLLGLIYGVLHEEDPLGGVDFAIKLAVCARLCGGDQQSYAKAVRKLLVSERELFEVFPKGETEQTARDFLRASRKARGNPVMLEWLGKQFENPYPPAYMKDYLVAAERSLCRVFMASPNA